MQTLRFLSAALIAVVFAVPMSATVPPSTPEQVLIQNKRDALEHRARAAFGEVGVIEKLRDWRKHWGFILVGEEGSRSSPRLLIKDEYGWYQTRSGGNKRLPVALGLELDRLLHQPDLWAEDAVNPDARCKGPLRLFLIMHAGQEKFGRIGCGPEGLAARVARTADAVQRLAGAERTTATARGLRASPVGASAAYHDASYETSARLFEMAASWERKTLAGFVDAYAPDVILEGPFGTYRGRRMAVDWVRNLQDWNASYSEDDKRLRVERIVSKNQPAKQSFYAAHELRWEEAGNPVRQTFSTLWRKRAGLWLIGHQKISEVKAFSNNPGSR